MDTTCICDSVVESSSLTKGYDPVHIPSECNQSLGARTGKTFVSKWHFLSR